MYVYNVYYKYILHIGTFIDLYWSTCWTLAFRRGVGAATAFREEVKVPEGGASAPCPSSKEIKEEAVLFVAAS